MHSDWAAYPSKSMRIAPPDHLPAHLADDDMNRPKVAA